MSVAPQASNDAATALKHIAPGYLTPKEASEYLRVPVGTLALWRCTNRVRLRYSKLGGRVRYALEDLDQFFKDNLRNAA